jgi:uncharacterized protein (TIGR03437 family)
LGCWRAGFADCLDAANLCVAGALNPPVAANVAPGITVTLNGGGPGSPQAAYAGGAPTLLCGVTQINMVVPSQTLSGIFEVLPWCDLRDRNSYYGVQN